MSDPLKTIDAFDLPPDSGGTVKAFSRIGYDLTEALADLVDNSIDASAGRVEITFNRTNAALSSVTVADNGRGMTSVRLREAMRFAGSQTRPDDALGIYGLGMKSASLSQCQSVTVLSKAENGAVAGCRWTETSIRAGWRCEVLDSAGAAARFAASYGGSGPPTSGTVILWEQLDRLSVKEDEGELDVYLQQLLPQLDARLGLIFHRFIGARFGIVLRVRHSDHTGLPRRVRAHDPFAYPASGREGYPRVFNAKLPDGSRLALNAHIWPYGSTLPEFLLGRRRGTPHQGIYFYRNNRLIQAGGWHGVVKETADPELGLARISVDLPPGLVDTNVQKSTVQTTAGFTQILSSARAGRIPLSEYFEEARRAFRQGRRKPTRGMSVPLAMGAGVPVALQRLTEPADAISRPIDFSWEDLPKGVVFEVDAASDRISLNRLYRQKLSNGAGASAVDLPVIKTLLFFLLEGELESSRLSARRRSRLERMNRLLFEAVRSR